MATHDIETPVAGNVWQVEVKPGQPVAEGDVLVILESMKMEIPVESTVAGHVVNLLVAAGDSVDEGQIVAVVDDAAAR